MIRIIEDDGVPVRQYKKDVWVSKANCYSPIPSIKLGVDAEKYLVLACVAHEWGHIESVRISRAGGKKCLSFTLAAKDNIGIALNDEEAKAVVKDERRAWFLGFKLLRDNGIPVDKKMLHARRMFVDSHVRRLGLT